MTTAKRRAIDQIRRDETYRRKVEEAGRAREESAPDIAALVAEDDGIARAFLVPEVAIAACHARARRFSDTGWERIARLYERLAEAARSPVVELTRNKREQTLLRDRAAAC